MQVPICNNRQHMTQTKYKTDIAIIGAGPVGLFAAFQCGMLNMDCHVIDALPDLGGQCRALYPEKPIYDIAGLPSVKAGDLIDNLIEQAKPFDPTYHLNQQVVSLLKDEDDNFHVVTDNGTEIVAKAVFIAAGPGAFGPNKPPLDNLEDFEKTSVHYMVSDPTCFKDQTIMIAGGGDSALDWVNTLSIQAKKIYLVHRRDRFRAAPQSVSQMEALAESGHVEKVIPYQLKGLEGESGKLKSVEVATLKGDVRSIDCDHLLCFYGLNQNLGPIREWDLDINGYHIEIDPTTACTNRTGIYAMGDVATYEHKLKLIATGFAEAAQAAHHAYNLVYPDQALHFEYSTTKGLPGSEKKEHEKAS